MLALTCAGSVGTLPCLGRFAGLLACSAEGSYWQLAPRSAAGLNAGSGGIPDDVPGAALVDELPVAAACLSLCSRLVRTTVVTTATTTTAAATDPPTMASIRRRRACWARRSSCRSSLRLAVARRCSLVGTAEIPPWLCAESGVDLTKGECAS